MYNSNFSEFEEEILNRLKETEKKMKNHFNTKYSEIFECINDFEYKFSNLKKNNETLLEALANQNLFIKKLNDLETFKSKTDDTLMSHDLKIKSSTIDLNDLKDKYDKIITENLVVPGFIGNSCQYKNLSQYLLFNMDEVNKIKTEKNDEKEEIKKIKFKFDNLMKTIISLNDGSLDRCKDYINNMQKYITDYVENKLNEYNEKKFEIKEDIMKNNLLYEEKFKEINIKVFETKKELIDIFNGKIDEIMKIMNIMIENFETNSKNIQKNSNDIQNINNKIKDINLNIKEINNNIKNKTDTAQQTKESINPIYSPRKNIKKILTKIDKNNGASTDNSNLDKIIKKINNIDDITIGNKGKKLRSIKSSKLLNGFGEIIELDEKIEKNQNGIENDTINDSEKIIKNKNTFSDNNSFEKSKGSKLKNIKNLKIIKSNSEYNLNNNKIDQNNKFKNMTTINKETIDAKSISPLRDDKLKINRLINNYKSMEDITQSPKNFHPLLKSNIKTLEELDDNNTENANNMKINNNLKLNLDLINDIHRNKILDLYNFSTSPPDGKINLKMWALSHNLSENLIKNEKQMENEKEKELGVNSQLAQMESILIKKNKIKVKGQNNIRKDRNKLLKIKNKDRQDLSIEKIKSKNINLNYNLGINSPILEMPPRIDVNINKSISDNDYNSDYFKLKKALKELNINK